MDLKWDVNSFGFGRGVFIALMVLISLGLYALLGKTIRSGHVPGSVLLVYVSSPLLMFLVWWLVQYAQPTLGSIDLRQASAAAIVGDALVIPVAVGLLAIGWQKLNHESLGWFWQSGWWFWLSFAVGLAGGIGFHLMGGKADAQSSNLDERLHDSPLSWCHNLGVFPALLAALVYTLLPLLVTSGESRAWAWWAFGVLGGWLALSILDGIRMTRFSVTNPWRHDPHWLDTDGTNWRLWWTRLLDWTPTRY